MAKVAKTIEVDECDRLGCGATGRSVQPRPLLTHVWEAMQAINEDRSVNQSPATPQLCAPCDVSVTTHVVSALRRKRRSEGEVLA